MDQTVIRDQLLLYKSLHFLRHTFKRQQFLSTIKGNSVFLDIYMFLRAGFMKRAKWSPDQNKVSTLQWWGSDSSMPEELFQDLEHTDH